MKREKIIDLFRKADLIGTEVTVMGWVRTRRGNKHVQFVALNDGSTVRNIQVVLDMARFSDDELKPITTGSSLRVQGKLVESMGKGQSVEVQADSIEVFGTADPEVYPLQKKGHTLEFLLRKPICVRAQIRSELCCACAVHLLLLSTASFRNVVSSTSTLRLSPVVTAREPGLCSR